MFDVHGVGGLLGGVLTTVFALPALVSINNGMAFTIHKISHDNDDSLESKFMSKRHAQH
ncbi:hypothetical protein [Cupriavidus sp. UYPR2.512]|uniref:hypothetical protein n=1 Tax=Cupriavidus sp. UYPR2.512 TaxID=1080187 RepID=UPI0012F84D95|nr:hypothetical protein KAF44_38885 [Cupriavidus necator]